ncbi:hypothetical protein [Phthorimaea operculella granulovirus]|uniref:Per os infectivity factor 3 n=1 Tax=Phthorimaea operculella granulovirus TaxID=192584 RepID=Q8JS28_9BBAC|nr:hypothetical protein [Phthorimaea operculella granulovirus]AAM70229.1 hypothetical protein [Phthorimaea operculella granulovirus]ANY57420.1 hypothetical protein PhopGVgp031 [Phthorimaea operculella granulovirus]QBH65866.1 hypothetical protein PhopGVgp031 [Phthorimaea operculella granulovirus]QBH65996.1 hypothetical protein PhopGVgp031 [Phthorimaea operculella granulovirus]QBH66126.1 hypothetical protein PhopGVgp031 [Phthorimaea operculella granulovirus]
MIIVLLLVIMTILIMLSTKKRTNIEHMVNLAPFDRNNIFDCEQINVPCVSHDQCRDNCLGMMRCNDAGFCGPGNTFVVRPETCDIERGLITVYTDVGLLCISLYRDVIDDSGQLRPYICSGGTMTINLEDGPFSIEDCVCPPNHTKFSFTSGAFTRAIPVCVPNIMAALYRRVYGEN